MTVKPRAQIFIKFVLLCGLLIGYFGYLSYEYGVTTGGVAALLTWSFFVLCTPVADAGFLLDFPLRLLFGIRMVVSEIAVWIVALSLNAVALLYAPSYYKTTILTELLREIFMQPFPYWGVILLSGLGTFCRSALATSWWMLFTIAIGHTSILITSNTSWSCSLSSC